MPIGTLLSRSNRTTTNYTLDPAGNITRELVTGDGAKDVTYFSAAPREAGYPAPEVTRIYEGTGRVRREQSRIS